MFVPDTHGFALLLMVLCAVCWGSWANTFKLAGGVRFELFYWDYALGIFLTAGALAVTLGSWHGGGDAFFANLVQATGPRVALALAAGAIFNLANLLLVGAIALSGMAIAFPIGIGTALVLGTVLTYAVDRTGDAVLLFVGVGLAVLAIVADALAYKELAGGAVALTRKGITVSVVAGLLMGSWSPLTAASMAEGAGALTPYTSTFYFTLAAFVSTFFFNVYLMRRPLAGTPVSLASYVEGDPGWHLWGLLGGFVWSLGTAFNLIAGSAAGFAVSYAMGQSAPMVAALWGVFVWREFQGASRGAKGYLALMFVFYAAAILVIARAF